MNEEKLYIHENWSNKKPICIGYLYIDKSRGKETYSFEFNKSWLVNNRNVFLDPDLYYTEGRQYLTDKPIFGFLADSCPDRWGRLLIDKKEIEVAKRKNRPAKTLTEIDYLKRVNDKGRMGALRISWDENGRFLSDGRISKIKNIRDIEALALNFLDEEEEINEKSLDQLLSPGSSLGGAWPKATFEDMNGDLWIAKFPSRNNESNKEAWEMVAHDLLKLCKINVPEAKIESYSKYGATYLSKRFDRNKDRRIHFASAMTLLGKTDNDNATGYIDIASIITSHGSNPEEDLKELYSRLIFNACITNTDDHLRNHGFLLTENGWKLSPAYDINPLPKGDELAIFITKNDKTISKENIISISEFFGLSNEDAVTLFNEISKIIKANWESLAKKYKLTNKQINNMSTAFRICYK